jgi:dipeptide/tripeptide permease
MRLAGVALAACCLLLALAAPLPVAGAIPVLVLSMVALTAGELFQSAGGWGLSYQLAREGEQAAYLSVFWLGVSVQQILAPLVVAAVLFAGASAWIGLGTVLVLTGLVVPVGARWAETRRACEGSQVTAATAGLTASAG